MSRAELESELAAGVIFSGWETKGELAGVMGLQQVRDATLIRHAYVRPAQQGRGIGGALLKELVAQAKGPVLVGTWAAAVWAIRLYEKHGFRMTSEGEKDRLLETYWKISDRQRATSVVLVQEAGS
jgi:GNAT superfamily N-acetyltransferase